MGLLHGLTSLKFTVFLHICISFTCYRPTDSGAVSLTQSTIDTTLATSELVFINFYAEWCRFSNMLAPIFDEAATKVAAEFPQQQVVMGKVDCDKENSIATRFHITKYPTLKVIQNGQPAKREYRGQRSVDAFYNFVKKQLEDPIKEFKELNELKNLDTKKRIIIGFFDHKDCPEYNTFRRVATTLKDDCQFHVGFGSVVQQMHPPNQPIVVFRPDVALSNERDETYNGSLTSYDETNIWMSERCIPLVREITFENAEELTEEGLPFLILFHKPNDEEIIKRFKDIMHNDLIQEKHVALSKGSLTSYDETNIWMSERCIPLVREITFENAEELTEEGLPFLILFHKPNDEAVIKRFKEIVHNDLIQEKQNINFLTADGERFAHPLHHLGKGQDELPLIAIDSFRHMYLFPDIKDMETPGKLLQFIKDLYSGKLHREFHHGPDPNEVLAIEHKPSGAPTTPPESTFKKLGPSKNRYTLLRDEL